MGIPVNSEGESGCVYGTGGEVRKIMGQIKGLRRGGCWGAAEPH